MKPQDMKDLRELSEFLKQYQVAEFDLDRGDLKIRLKFAQAAAASPGIADLARLAAASVTAAAPAALPSGEPAGAMTPSRSRRRPAHRQVAHRRNVLRFALARSCTVCLPRGSRRKRTSDLHRRSHEIDERDRVGCGRGSYEMFFFYRSRTR